MDPVPTRAAGRRMGLSSSTQLPDRARQQPRLDSLPTELIREVLSHLVPRLPDIGVSAPIDYEKLIPEEQWYEPTRQRLGLRSACLVSRKLSAVAKPLLYNVIPIIDVEHITLLLRTLIENPGYGSWARSLAVYITLTEPSICREIRVEAAYMFEDIPEHVMVNHRDMAVRQLNRSRQQPAELRKRMPQLLTYAMICLLPRIETLMLQVPLLCIDYDLPEYKALIEYFDLTPEQQRPCQNVTKFMLQADPAVVEVVEYESRRAQSLADSEQGLTGCAAGRYWHIMAACPKLRTIEVNMDDGWWIASNGKPKTPPSMENVTSLSLNHTLATPQQVASVMKLFPRLEELYVEPHWSGENESVYDAIMPQLSLDEALVSYGQMLRHLDLGWFNCQHCMEGIGEDGILTNLHQLKNLETLCIQFALLFHSIEGRRGPEMSVYLADLNLANLFPDSLQGLTLEDWWWPDSFGSLEVDDNFRNWNSDSFLDYRNRVVAMLSSFATSIQNHPQLRRVAFLTRVSNMWKYRTISFQSCMAPIQEEFARSGVRFTYHEI